MIKWDATNEEVITINKIYDRARKKLKINKTDFMMDIEATHCNGCPLNLNKLLDFPAFDFWHDIHGIAVNINKSTGELKNCFLPRCSV